MMRLELDRTGGFGGAARRFEVDEASLASSDRAELRRLVAGAALASLPEVLTVPAPAVDRFTYRLTVEEGAERREVRFTELAMTEGLRELVRWVEGRG